MFERVSTCLESGARLSFKTARSNERLLHAQFWSPSPIDNLAALLDNTGSQERRGGLDTFLDFLYPTAWLKTQSYERWELRNARRLPHGFIHASRRFSSHSNVQRDGSADSLQHHTFDRSHDSRNESAQHDTPRNDRQSELSQHHTSDVRTTSDGVVQDYVPKTTIKKLQPFGLTTSQNTTPREEKPKHILLPPKAEHKDARMRYLVIDGRTPAYKESAAFAKKIRNMITAPDQIKEFIIWSRLRLKTTYREQTEPYTEELWSLFKAQETQEKSVEVLRFLALHHSDTGDTRCMELYDRLKPELRSPKVYKAMIVVYARCHLIGLAYATCLEASQAYERTGVHTPRYFALLIANNLATSHWSAACEAYQYYVKKHGDGEFWTAQLWYAMLLVGNIIPQATALALHMTQKHEPDHEKLFILFLKSAVDRDLRHSHGSTPDIDSQLHLVKFVLERSSSLEGWNYIHRLLTDITSDPAVKFEPGGILGQRLLELWEPLCKNEGTREKIDKTMLAYLKKEIEFRRGYQQFTPVNGHYIISALITVWQGLSTHISREGQEELMQYYASIGALQELQFWADKYRLITSDKLALANEIYVHAVRGDTQKARQAFLRIKAELATEGKRPALEHWIALMKAFRDNIPAARRVHDRVRKPEIRALLIRYHADQGDTRAVRRLLRKGMTVEMEDSLLKTLTVSMQLRKALDTVKASTRTPIESVNGFNIVLEAFARLANYADSLPIYNFMMRGLPKNAATYGAIMQAELSRRTGDIQRKFASARDILFNILPVVGLRPTAQHFNVLLQAYQLHDRPREVLQLYERMMRLGVAPTPETDKMFYEAELTLLERDKRPAYMQVLYNSMQQYIQSHIEGKPPRYLSGDFEVLLRFVITTLSKYGKRTETVAILRGIQSIRPDLPRSPELLTTLLMSNYALRRWTQMPSIWYQLWDLLPGDQGKGTAADLKIKQFRNKSSMLSHGTQMSVYQRRRLSTATCYYFLSLIKRNRIQKALHELNLYQARGFTYDRWSLNMIIQQLLNLQTPLTLLAFTLAEKFLLRGWEGWNYEAIPSSLHINTNTEFMHVSASPDYKLLPFYDTIVMLGREYDKLEAGDRKDRKRSVMLRRDHDKLETSDYQDLEQAVVLAMTKLWTDDQHDDEKQPRKEMHLRRFHGTQRDVQRFAPSMLRIIESRPNQPYESRLISMI